MDGAAAAERAIAKVRKLLAMSASPNLEEARTSAFLACRLIREHGLQVTAHHPAPVSPRLAAAGPPVPQPAGFRRIRVRHPGRCRTCSDRIGPGEWAYWCRGHGLRHLLCHP